MPRKIRLAKGFDSKITFNPAQDGLSAYLTIDGWNGIVHVPNDPDKLLIRKDRIGIFLYDLCPSRNVDRMIPVIEPGVESDV